MDGFSREAMSRLPLAEAVIRFFDFLTDSEFLKQVFDRHRGRSYEQGLRFSSFVYLISDALLEHRGSAHRAIQQADEEGDLEVSMGAVYGKLRRIPITPTFTGAKFLGVKFSGSFFFRAIVVLLMHRHTQK